MKGKETMNGFACKQTRLTIVYEWLVVHVYHIITGTCRYRILVALGMVFLWTLKRSKGFTSVSGGRIANWGLARTFLVVSFIMEIST